MRTVTKFLAAAAIAAVSISSNAAIVSWTGTLSTITFKLYPTNGPDGATLVLNNIPTSTCTVAGIGTKYSMIAADNAAASVGVSDALSMLTAAKAAGATVTLQFETGVPNCPLMSITR
jgi:uncharacterized membrane protein